MPKLLLIGGNRSTVGAIRALRGAGFTVGVAEKLPRRHAFEVADRNCEVAADDLDGLRAEIRGWGGVQGIIGINETAMLSAAVLQREFGLPGLPPDVIRGTTSKLAQRQAWAGDPALAVPFAVVSSAADLEQAVAHAGGYPVIVKPDLSLGGSRGVSLATNDSEAEAACRFAEAHALPGSSILVETALEGPQFSAELMTRDGVTRALAIGRKVKSASPYRVDLAVCYPGFTDDAAIADVERMAATACARLGITSGPGHIEFAITRDGPRPIELAARCGGSLTTDLAAHVSGYHPMVEAARLACGLPAGDWRNVQRRGAVLMLLAYPPGDAACLHIPESVAKDPAVLDLDVRLPDDGMIRPVQWTSQRIGFLGVVGDDGPSAMAHALSLAAQIRVEGSDGEFRPPLGLDTNVPDKPNR